LANFIHATFFIAVVLSAVPVKAQENPFKGLPLVAPPADQPNIFPEAVLDPAVSQKLDRLWAAKDWAALTQAAEPSSDIGKVMDWLKVKTDTGGSFLAPLLYVKALLNVGKITGNDGFRNQAGLMSLYTIALIHMDGMACADSTAVEIRLNQTAQGPVGDAIRYLKQQRADLKAEALKTAVQLEAVTANKRASEDELLCGSGMEGIKAGLDANSKSAPQIVPGMVGSTVYVGTPHGWKPPFNQAGVYRAKQSEGRGARLYDYLWPLVN
jgi:hypothetical protein